MTTTVARNAAQHARVAYLDGLRGLAVIAVVAFHCLTSLMHIPTGGYLGVPVFFMLSGFLITNMIWRSSQPPGWPAYRRFIARRLQRLGPAHLATVLIVTPAAILVGLPGWDAVRGGLASITQTMSLYRCVATNPQGPLDPTWSLSVEWWFYVLWPAGLFLAKRQGWTAVHVRNAAIVLALILYASFMVVPNQSFYFLPGPNLAVLLCGAAMALQSGVRSTTGTIGSSLLLRNTALALLLVLLAAPVGMFASGYRFATLPCTVAVTALLLGASAGGEGLAIRVLSNRALRFLGVRAYSIYLGHFALLWLTWEILRGASPAVVVAVALALLVPVVWASYRFLERPWLSGTQDPSQPRAKKGVRSKTSDTDPTPALPHRDPLSPTQAPA